MNIPGILYIVATPIGNLGDISARALKVLQEATLIAAEDTRHSSHLLHHFGITTPMIKLHDHNERQCTQELLMRIMLGSTVALISDAGTPLISDPGYHIVQQAHAMGIVVVPLPGPCAAIAALSAAGLPSDKFVFEGFLPAKTHARCQRLKQLKNETRTTIYYEAPHRILDSVTDMVTIIGAERHIVVARELTKAFETIHSATLGELIPWFKACTKRLEGEFVILMAGAEAEEQASIHSDILHTLHVLLAELPMKQAVQLAAKITKQKKNTVYNIALGICNELIS